MYIHVADGASHVREATDLKRLSVRVAAGTDPAASLGELGEIDPDGHHVWLRIATLRDVAAATVTDDVDAWRDGFDAMIAHAAKGGWTNGDGTLVRAHIDHG